MNTQNLEMLRANCCELQQGKDSLLLSTQGDEYPEISYAPYVSDEGGFYIFISQLAAHTGNLINRPCASIMFIADEGESQNVFARERVIYKCEATEIEKGSDACIALLDKMEKHFGNIVGMLRGLSDFKLFRLTPKEGHYVVGFGKAYTIDLSSGELIHITEEQVKKGR